MHDGIKAPEVRPKRYGKVKKGSALDELWKKQAAEFRKMMDDTLEYLKSRPEEAQLFPILYSNPVYPNKMVSVSLTEEQAKIIESLAICAMKNFPEGSGWKCVYQNIAEEIERSLNR